MSSTIVLIGTGKRITVEDVVNVSVYNHVVSAEAAQRNAYDDTTQRTRNNLQSVITSRAALFCRIASLKLSANVNPLLIQYLIDVLNSPIVPFIQTENDLGSFLQGKGQCLDSAGSRLDTLVCLDTLHMDRPPLSSSEINELIGFPFVSISMGCLIATAASNSLVVVDSIAALSCEGYGCYSEPFNSVHFELNRPHRGLLLTAHNLRLLLEGSKRMNSCNSDTIGHAAALHNTPQLVGPCRDSIISALK